LIGGIGDEEGQRVMGKEQRGQGPVVMWKRRGGGCRDAGILYNLINNFHFVVGSS
jgi:hypothetical protein